LKPLRVIRSARCARKLDGFARGGITMRRLAFAAAAAIVFSCAEGSSASAAPTKKGAPAKPAPRSPPSTLCTVHVHRWQQVLRFRTRSGVKRHLDYTHVTATPIVGVRGDASSRTTIALGDQVLLDVEAHMFGGALAPTTTQVLVRFGTAFSGVREVLLTSTDAKVLRGDVDGRAIEAFRIGAPLSALRFQDGKPAPTLHVEPTLERAIRMILARAKAEVDQCRKPTVLPQRAPSPDPPDPPDTGRSDSTSASTDCLSCMGGCTVAATGAAAACCVASFGIGCVLCVGGAVAGELACMKAECHGVGQPCCPTSCGDVACCFRTDTCLDPSRGVCCGPNTKPCNGRECCEMNDRCLPDGTCCPAGQAVCQGGQKCCQPGEACSTEGLCCAQPRPDVIPVSCRGQCCAADEVCKDGVTCCPPNDPVCKGACCRGGTCDADGNCCLPPDHLCGGRCCSAFSGCCGNTCCSPGVLKCAAGACCPDLQWCGPNVCCPAGQACQNPSTGACSGCAPGTVGVTCDNRNATSTGCCPPGVACCNGQCCPFDRDQFGVVACCDPVAGDVPPFDNFQFGCHHFDIACIK